MKNVMMSRSDAQAFLAAGGWYPCRVGPTGLMHQHHGFIFPHATKDNLVMRGEYDAERPAESWAILAEDVFWKLVQAVAEVRLWH